MKNILIIAPHPDDETLGCGGVLSQKIRKGWDARVILLTGGNALFKAVFSIDKNPSPAEVGEIRREETRRATAHLGMKPEQILMWNFNDGGLQEQFEQVTIRLATFITEFIPSEIYCHNRYEQHPDHVAANAITKAALAQTASPARMFEYIVSLRRGLAPEDIGQSRITVNIADAIDKKRAALNEFTSHLGIISAEQKRPLADNFDNYLSGEEIFFCKE